jgi:hypothetical protein
LKIKAEAEGPATSPITLPPLFKVSRALLKVPKVYCRTPIAQVVPEGLPALRAMVARLSPFNAEHCNTVAVAGIVQLSIPIEPTANTTDSLRCEEATRFLRVDVVRSECPIMP